MEKEALIAAEQCCTMYNVDNQFLQALQQIGLLDMAVVEEREFIDTAQLHDLEKIIRLNQELGINLEGIQAISYLLERMQLLQDELSAIRNRLRFYEVQ